MLGGGTPSLPMLNLKKKTLSSSAGSEGYDPKISKTASLRFSLVAINTKMTVFSCRPGFTWGKRGERVPGGSQKDPIIESQV